MIRIEQIDKSFGGVHALDRVSFEIGRGEVHALCGENGAGKSTLIKILCGAYTPDAGTITIDGTPLPFGRVPQVEAMGIAVMHQESTAFLDLNAIDNIFIGRELTNAWGLLDRKAMAAQTLELLRRLQEPIDIYKPLLELTVAQRQMVSMARALAQNCKLLIMDEPTASLSRRETEILFQNIDRLRADGVSILYISHRLEEIFRIADVVTVLRDGRRVGTKKIGEVTQPDLIKMMIGRAVGELTRRAQSSAEKGEIVLKVEGLARRPAFENIGFEVRAGEIVCMAGLVGSGRSEIARAVFGIDAFEAGTITIDGKLLSKHAPRDAMNAGIALAPEDRQHEGLLLPLPVSSNISLGILQRLMSGPFISRRRESELSRKYIGAMQIKTAGAGAITSTLSGGNQQKVVIGKWLATQPRVLILDEPTRGVDVGAKAEIYRIIRGLAEKGVAIWVISSDLPEVLHIADRILVLCAGRIRGELAGDAATQEDIMALALPDATLAGVADA